MSRGAEEVRFILELGDKKSFHANSEKNLNKNIGKHNHTHSSGVEKATIPS